MGKHGRGGGEKLTILTTTCTPPLHGAMKIMEPVASRQSRCYMYRLLDYMLCD